MYLPHASAGGRLRVALVVESMDSGVAQLIYVLARGLDRLGHEVHLLHAIDRIDTDILDRLRDEGRIRLAAIDMKRKLQASDFTAGLSLRSYLKKQGPFDVIHGHSSKAGALVRTFCVGLPGVRLYTPHAFYTLAPGLSAGARVLFGAAEIVLALSCDKIICSSELERRHAEALGIARRKLAVITNAIEPPRLAPPDRQRFELPDNAAFVVGFVGRLEHQKALDVLLQAFSRLIIVEPRSYLVVIGNGSLKDSLMALASDLGISDHIRWLGRQSVYQYLASFDAVAMPSRYEGFSLIPLDSMHAGLPIICTPVGGVEEAVVDGETGIVVPSADPTALATALVELSAAPLRRQAMGEAARARATLFTADRMVKATDTLYRATIANAPNSARATAWKQPPAREPVAPAETIH